MRLTPAQIAVRLICGDDFPPFVRKGESLAERMRDGREMLTQITGKDFGYDLAAWHDHLKLSRQGGYTYGRNIVLPKIMQAAFESPEWQETARRLSDGRKS